MNALPYTLRQFIRGVCALPDIAQESDKSRALRAEIELLVRQSKIDERVRSDLERRLSERTREANGLARAIEEVRRDLTSERDAHAETNAHLTAEHANGVELTREVHSLRARLGAVTKERAEIWERSWNTCCDYNMAKAEQPGRFIGEPPNPYAGEPSEDCLRPLSPEELAKVAPISEDAINEAIEKGRQDAEQTTPPTHTGFYR